MTNDPGQQHDIAEDKPEVVNQLRAAYQKYWADVSVNDQGWRGRPIVGATNAPEVELCGEDWFTTQGQLSVEPRLPWPVVRPRLAAGRSDLPKLAPTGSRCAAGRANCNAPIAGVPAGTKIVDAWLDGSPVQRDALQRRAPSIAGRSGRTEDRRPSPNGRCQRRGHREGLHGQSCRRPRRHRSHVARLGRKTAVQCFLCHHQQDGGNQMKNNRTLSLAVLLSIGLCCGRCGRRHAQDARHVFEQHGHSARQAHRDLGLGRARGRRYPSSSARRRPRPPPAATRAAGR